jgi:DNA-binding LacI/PurR family transcriptional regulator
LKQKDIAELCGVSPATVAKALRNSREISEETKKKILACAAENGYVQAKPKRPKFSSVLVFVPEYRSEYYGEILSITNELLNARDYAMYSFEYKFDNENIKKYLKKTELKFDGIIFIGSDESSYLDLNIPVDMPVVTTDYVSKIFDSVYQNKNKVFYETIKGLVRAGHKRIAFIGDPYTLEKENAFYCAVRSFRIDCEELIYRSENRFAVAGSEGFYYLFSLPEPPTAVICAYDYIVLGVLNAAEINNISVLHKLSVIGCDDIRASSSYKLGITTINSKNHECYEKAVDLLHRRIICEETGPAINISIDCELIIRETAIF